MTKRLPPQHIEAEQAVLGALLLDQSAWDEIVDLISGEDFYKPSHRKLFQSIHELKKRDLPTDLITVSNHLIEKSELDQIGGPSFLAELLDQTPTSANIGAYAKIIQEKALLRKVISSSQEFVETAFNQNFESLDIFLDSIEAEIFKIAERKTHSGLVDAADLVRISLERIESLYATKMKVTGVPSGFIELDEMTAGFQPGEMTIIAARPSMGKTAFSLNVALGAALKEKKKVAYFSVEMGKEAVMIRLLASCAKVRLSDIRIGNLDEKAWPRLIQSAAQLSETSLFIDDTSGISPFEIRAKARRLKSRHGLDMIVIDYLQLMDLKQRMDSREREVSEISRLLKSIAKELQVPVIALAQLNRGVEGRTDKRPMLSDLRESGSIEQDADVIMMLFREDYYDRENPDIKGIAEVIIGKQRNGPTGAVKLKWIPEIGVFDNLIRNPEAPMPDIPPPNSRFGAGGQRRPPNMAPGKA